MPCLKGKGINGGVLDRFVHYGAYLYIGLPIIIFFLGWIKWYLAIPLVLIVIFSFSKCFIDIGKHSRSENTIISRSTLFAIFMIACIWVYLSGIGGYVFQNYDHFYRNGIFNILVEKPWPPTKTLSTSAGYRTNFLSYYIGFWLPAALFGKIFGLEAGYFFQLIWAILGALIVFCLLLKTYGKWSISSILIFVLFSGLDIAGCAFLGNDIFSISIQDHIETWSGYQFSSHMTQLFWVFNQAIYGWLLTLLILDENDNKHLILFWSCGLIECTFPFVGLFPFLIYKIIANVNKQFRIKRFFRWTNGLFSVENILGGGIIGIISFLYIFSNTSSQSSSVLSSTMSAEDLFVYLLFIFVETGIYFSAINKFQKKNPLFYISLAILLLCPLIRIGGSIDFCMRASIPALLVLCILVTESMNIAWQKDKMRFFAILGVFLIGSVTPIHEVFRTTSRTISYHSSGGIKAYAAGDDSVFEAGNFTSSADNSLFAKYFTNIQSWSYGKIDASGGVIGEIIENRIVEQYFEVQDDISISSLSIFFATYMRTNNCSLDIYIKETEKEATHLTTIDCSILKDNAVCSVTFEPYNIQKNKQYSLLFISSDATPGNAVTIYRSMEESQDWEYAVIDGERQKYALSVGLGQS